MTRRTLLRRLAKTGGAVGVLSMSGGLITACGLGNEAVDDAPADANGTPARGGVIRYSVSSNPAGFDPPRFWNSLVWNGIIAVFDRLVGFAEDGELVPELLVDLPEIERDGTFFTLNLREGVTFQHGRELVADDVKFSLERLMGPAVESEGAGLYTGVPIVGLDAFLNEADGDISGIEIVGDKTLTIELEEPDSSFLYVLGLPFASIVPRDVVEDVGNEAFNFAPIGTGPFEMMDVDPSRSLVLERYEDHWRDDRPYVDRVEWDIGVETDLAILRIERGELDIMEEEVPAGQLASVRDNPDLQDNLFIGDVNNCMYITLGLDHEALADERVRRAIAMAIDKERAVRVIQGMGTPADGGLFSPLSPYYQPGLSPEYDPETARELLAEAGYADGFDVEFWGTNYSPFLEYSQSVQQDLEELGIRVELHNLVREGWHAVIVENPPGITQNNWELPYPHGSYIMDGAFTQAALDAGCCNFSNWTDQEFEQLVKDARRAVDEDEIVSLYKRMDEIAIGEQALWVPIFYPRAAYLVSDSLKNYSIPASPDAGVKFFANYWIEE